MLWYAGISSNTTKQIKHLAEIFPKVSQYIPLKAFPHELVEWAWGDHENKDDRIILRGLWKQYPLVTAPAKTRVNILKSKWHSQCAERKAAGVLCWNQRKCLDWGLWKKDMTHTLHWRQLAVLKVEECTVGAGNWLNAWGEFYCATLLCLCKNREMKQCVENPTIGMHILTWQR